MTARNYSGSAQATTLASPIGSGDTTFTVTAAVNWPSTSFIVTLDVGTASEEKVLVGSRSGTTCNSVTRGYDDTAALSHLVGASARHTFSAVDAREANTHVNATTGVHGVTGSVVGTGGSQTLTGKTLVTPVLTTPTMSDPVITGSLTLPSGSVPQAAVTGLAATLAAAAATDAAALAAAVANMADTTGAETVSGLWTFSTRPVLPNPILGGSRVNHSTGVAVTGTTLTTIHTVTVTAPANSVIQITGSVYISTPAGVGAVASLTGMSSTDSITLDRGSLDATLDLYGADVIVGAGGSKTYNLKIATTIAGQDVTWYTAFIKAVQIA